MRPPRHWLPAATESPIITVELKVPVAQMFLVVSDCSHSATPTRLLSFIAQMGVFGPLSVHSPRAPRAEKEYMQVLHAPAFKVKGRRRYVSMV